MSSGFISVLNFLDNICESYERKQNNERKENENDNLEGIRNIRRLLSIRNINRDYDNNRYVISNMFNYDSNNTVSNLLSMFVTNYMNSEEENKNEYKEDNDIKNNDINSINIHSYLYDDLDEKTKENNDNCSICFEKINSEDVLSITSCNHIYHYNCLDKWIESKKECLDILCPLCRTNLRV